MSVLRLICILMEAVYDRIALIACFPVLRAY